MYFASDTSEHVAYVMKTGAAGSSSFGRVLCGNTAERMWLLSDTVIASASAAGEFAEPQLLLLLLGAVRFLAVGSGSNAPRWLVYGFAACQGLQVRLLHFYVQQAQRVQPQLTVCCYLVIKAVWPPGVCEEHY